MRGAVGSTADRTWACVNLLCCALLPFLPAMLRTGQTKWVCERRLANHVTAGRLQSLTIARVGLIGPCSATGAGNYNDWLHIFCQAVAHVNAAPAMCKAASVAMLPVDTTAQSLAVLAATSLKEGTHAGQNNVAIVCLDGYAAGMQACSVHALLDALYDTSRINALSGGVASNRWTLLGYEAWRHNVRLCGDRCVQKVLAVLPTNAAVDEDEDEVEDVLQMRTRTAPTDTRVNFGVYCGQVHVPIDCYQHPDFLQRWADLLKHRK